MGSPRVGSNPAGSEMFFFSSNTLLFNLLFDLHQFSFGLEGRGLEESWLAICI